jgi:hypothetical protein
LEIKGVIQMPRHTQTRVRYIEKYFDRVYKLSEAFKVAPLRKKIHVFELLLDSALYDTCVVIPNLGLRVELPIILEQVRKGGQKNNKNACNGVYYFVGEVVQNYIDKKGECHVGRFLTELEDAL